MTDLLTAPTERPPVSSLGPTSSLPERVGCDILWQSRHGLVGVQRKEIMDLVSSVRDGRLGRELEMMKSSLHTGFVIIEGQPSWDRDGNLNTQHTRWSMRQHDGVLLSIQTKGIPVIHSRNALETCQKVEYLVEWSNRDEHVSSLLARPGPQKNGWGKLSDRATAIHVYSGLPSVGPERAARIYDAGLRLLRCGVTVEELMTVDGIGKVTAEKICKSLAS